VDESDEELVSRIRSSRESGDVVQTALTTDKRVLARVTDGIYRQPGSALRELISNAYDADAGRVLIQTDRPRFRRISVRDDGVGMSIEALAHMIRHIGGSAKRSASGGELGVTDAENSAYSPAGRRLIGRLGIGLFSVSQLTQRFRVATKREGETWRSIASVTLQPYVEPGQSDESATVTTGFVQIWQEQASDAGSRGTTVVLDAIRPSALKTLQTAPEWQRIASGETRITPRFHVGHYRGTDDEVVPHSGRYDALPWGRENDPEANFSLLVDSVWDELWRGDRNPKLDHLLDQYLQMVWGLALAIPAPYVHGHPFDIPLGSTRAYRLPGGRPDAAVALPDASKQTVRSLVPLAPAGTEGSTGFRVQIDDLVLKRPLKFRDLPSTSHALKHPLLFVGSHREEFEGVDRTLSGGPIEFQAYFLWAPKVAPVEHNGVLIRLHGASGTLFDPSFMNFKLAEITRLRQITCEIFVTEGLEAALNIDRESFNDAHPHTVRLTRWLHAALARVINQQKSIANRLHREARAHQSAEQLTELDNIVRDLWDEQAWDGEPAEVVMGDATRSAPETPVNAIHLPRSAITGAPGTSKAAKSAEARLLALTRVLDAFDLLDELEADDRNTLLRYIFRVLRTEG
jgi:hypothetical protein